MSPAHRPLVRRMSESNIWFERDLDDPGEYLASWSPRQLVPEVLPSEQAVGAAMLAELERLAENKGGDLIIILLGGRGAQAMHQLIGERAADETLDQLLGRLRVFTQDALAPMRMASGLSFVRDFERLLGDHFLRKVKSFSSFRTDAEDLELEAARYVELLEAAGGADIFFLGHGPEPEGASHLAYIKPGSGAHAADVAGLMPISSSILEHHVTKFKAGGSTITANDETECRQASHLFTLGPAAILNAKLLVQSIVDADTAPAKRVSYKRVLETEFADDLSERSRQLDENPGLWIRLHPNVRSFVLPNVLAS
ncbi:MAG: hypothetical protein ABI882_12955 [Acidobacteriota bacterium]